MQSTALFALKGCPVHLESTARGVETQPYHLPWTDPDCTEHRKDPEYLQYNDIIVWGDTAEVFEETKRIIQILLKTSFALKQNTIKGPVQDILFIMPFEFFYAVMQERWDHFS